MTVRRILLWFLSTVTVLVLLFSYRTSTSGPSAAGTVVAAPATSAPSAQASPGAGSGSGSGSPGSGSTGTTTSGTATGPVVQTRWGPVQVQITVSDGKITAVSVPQYPNGNQRDAEINAYALPILVQDTLDQQSAGIDMVTGATVTSEGYLQSLQGALDQAGL